MLARDIEMFIEHCGLKGLSTKTVNSYEQTLRLFMQYMDEQGILLTEKITHLAIQGYIKSIKERGKYTVTTNPNSGNYPDRRVDFGKRVSDVTINNYLRNLRVFFNWCVEEELILRSPVKKGDFVKVERKPLEFVSDEDFKRLLKSMNSASFSEYRDSIIIQLLLDTGMRVNECLLMNPYYDTNVLYDAGDRAMNGSQFKYASKLYKLNQLLITAKLQKALQNGTYHPKGSMKFRYRERGKERLISSIVTPDKAVNHVICDEVLTPYLQKFLQYDNSASQKGKGVAFHRRRFENDLRNYYREEGTNEGYVLFIDFSGYYANIQHEPCKAVLHELLEKSGLSDELRLITEDLMDKIFKTFEMDVSRFPDEDIQAMMNGKVDPFMNMGVPKELLTGEKMLAKGTDIGNQLAQNIGIVFPYRIDNYCKIVCGMKHQGRYSDDMHIIHRSKEVLLEVLEGIKKIAAEYGLILNEKKTHICKLSSDYRYLQVKYTLLQNGVVVRRIHPKAITRERRKLKAYKRLLDKGIVTIEEIDGYFRSWLSGNYKYMSRDQIYKMNSLYVKLFGRSVTWKKGHGRLRWLMAHPSAA